MASPDSLAEVYVVELENRNANGSPSSALPGTQPTSGARAAVQETSRTLEQQAKHTAESAKDQIRSFAEVGKDRVADQLEQVASALRHTGDSLRDGEQAELSRYTDSIGEQIERASRYLREHQAIDLVDGVERFARTQPALFLGGAFVIGLAVGRFLKSSAPASTAIGEGYETGGYGGYAEPEDAVRTAPVQSVGTPPRNLGEVPSVGSSVTGTASSVTSTGPAIPGVSTPSTQTSAPVYPAPSGTFRGPGSDQS